MQVCPDKGTKQVLEIFFCVGDDSAIVCILQIYEGCVGELCLGLAVMLINHLAH